MNLRRLNGEFLYLDILLGYVNISGGHDEASPLYWCVPVLHCSCWLSLVTGCTHQEVAEAQVGVHLSNH